MVTCKVCGAAGSCPHEASSGLELDFDRGRPPPASTAKVVAPFAPVRAAPLPLPVAPPLTLFGLMKIRIAIGLGVGLVVLVLAGAHAVRTCAEHMVDEAATRPYPAPSRLVIASVTSDYGSDALDDGSLVLRKMPRGPALGFAAWYRASDAPTNAFLEQPTYRALAAPAEPCRSDAETSITTLGEVSTDAGKITLWTCTMTKKNHAYFLAWAMRSSLVDANEQRVTSMIKGTQLVSNDLCAVNVINGGCQPSAAELVTSLLEHARK